MAKQTEAHLRTWQPGIIMRALAVVMLCIVATAGAACGDAATPETQVMATKADVPSSSPAPGSARASDDISKTKAPTADIEDGRNHDGDASSSASSDESKSDKYEDGNGEHSKGEDEDGEHSSASSDGDDSDTTSSGDDETASNANQITGSSAFDWAPNQALRNAEPLDVVTWTSGPLLSPGALSGEGTIDADVVLFDPMLGDGAAFAVYHDNYDDAPMLVLLPRLSRTMIWDTNLTVAGMDYEVEGQSFTFRAHSPLFFDGVPSDLKLRVYGFDNTGNPALLAISDIK